MNHAPSESHSVEFGQINSTVHAVGTDDLIQPKVLQRIVETVLRMIEQREEHGARVAAEQQVSRGVSYELDNK